MTFSDFGLSRRYMIRRLTALTFQIYEKHYFGDNFCAGCCFLTRQFICLSTTVHMYREMGAVPVVIFWTEAVDMIEST
jgi:hypothetical protein